MAGLGGILPRQRQRHPHQRNHHVGAFKSTKTNQPTNQPMPLGRYPCPAPFCSAPSKEYVASAAFAEITLPAGWVLVNTSTAHVLFAESFAPGQTATVSWLARVQDTWDKTLPTALVVTAAGAITGSVPSTFRSKNSYYPGYNYSDLIGGTSTSVMY
jgi:hypothetical protein